MDDAEKEQLLQRFERDFSVDRRGRMRVRNPVRPYALLGLLVGAIATTGIAVTGRGGYLTTGILQIVLALCVVLSALVLLASLVVGGRGRRAGWALLGLGFGALIALFVLGIAARLLDLDLS